MISKKLTRVFLVVLSFVVITASILPAGLSIGKNGTADQVEINRAIMDLYLRGGGTVVLSDGVFIVSDNIFLRTNVNLVGSGNTTIRLHDNASLGTAGMLRTVSGASNLIVKNIELDGNKVNQVNHGYEPGTGEEKQFGFYSGEKDNVSDSIRLENLYVHDFVGYGVDPHQLTSNLTIIGCTISNNGYDGLTTDGTNYSVFSNNIIRGNQRHGINIITFSNHNIYENNTVYNNGGDGIVIQNESFNCTLINNIIFSNWGNGVFVSSNYNFILENEISENQQSGIKIYGGTNNVVRKNILKHNSQTRGYSEIYLRASKDSPASNNVVTENIIIASMFSFGIETDISGPNFIYNNDIIGSLLSGTYFAKQYNAYYFIPIFFVVILLICMHYPKTKGEEME